MTSAGIAGAWQDFLARAPYVVRPETEDQYVRLVALVSDLTDRYDCNVEPYGPLFDLLTGYLHDWELVREPELKQPDVEPSEVLASLMGDRGLSQSELARDLQIDQGNLSRILSGERGISKALLPRLARYFHVAVDAFL